MEEEFFEFCLTRNKAFAILLVRSFGYMIIREDLDMYTKYINGGLLDVETVPDDADTLVLHATAVSKDIVEKALSVKML